jgi:hypothetical protein
MEKGWEMAIMKLSDDIRASEKKGGVSFVRKRKKKCAVDLLMAILQNDHINSNSLSSYSIKGVEIPPALNILSFVVIIGDSCLCRNC